MEHRPLGRTGVQVSKLCLGTMMFGAWGNTDHDDSIRIIHRALDAGITFVDTADVYSAGESEEIVGKALKGRRDDVVLATKFFMPMGDEPNMRGGSRRWIVRAVEDSLRRLGTDWIDLYQVHRPEPGVDVEETLGALSDLVQQGKVRYIGSSSYNAGEIVDAQWTARERRLQRFRTEQPPYSLRPAASSSTSSRPPGGTAWASSRTARWPAAGCPGAGAPTARRPRPPVSGWRRASTCRCPRTSASSKRSSGSSRSPTTPGCP
jgi:aryl-alcohol dehydrogenase-like predicted oxidoreductase